MSKPAWANEEENRANKLVAKGNTSNNDALQLKRVEKKNQVVCKKLSIYS